jgi:hypothetical protein
MRTAAKKMQSGGERLLKYTQGIFTLNDVQVNGKEFVAYPDQVGHGWTLFLGKKLIEERITLMIETDAPPRPDSHNDETKWERGPNGDRKDPWVFQHHLPVTELETGETAVFKTGSKGGANAIGKLMDEFWQNPQLGRPIIALDTDRYKNARTGGWTDFPVLKVVGYDPLTGPLSMPDPMPKEDPISTGPMKPVTKETTPTKAGADDMNDDLPF